MIKLKMASFVPLNTEYLNYGRKKNFCFFCCKHEKLRCSDEDE